MTARPNTKNPLTGHRRRDSINTYLNRIMRQTNWIYRGYEVCFSILSKSWYADPMTAFTSEYRVRATSREGIIAEIDAAIGAESYQPA